MGFSRASKDLLHKVTAPLRRRKALNDLTTDKMNKKYPGGWSQTPTTMLEFEQMRKKTYRNLGK